MAYSVRFRTRAKQELERCLQTYGGESEVTAWFGDLAQEAAEGGYNLSIDLSEVLKDAAEGNLGEDLSSWRHSWRRWLNAQVRDRIKAVVVTLKRRAPPWELRAAVKVFSFLAGILVHEVHVHFEVDHVVKQIVLTQFTGLPGQ